MGVGVDWGPPPSGRLWAGGRAPRDGLSRGGAQGPGGGLGPGRAGCQGFFRTRMELAWAVSSSVSARRMMSSAALRSSSLG